MLPQQLQLSPCSHVKAKEGGLVLRMGPRDCPRSRGSVPAAASSRNACLKGPSPQSDAQVNSGRALEGWGGPGCRSDRAQPLPVPSKELTLQGQELRTHGPRPATPAPLSAPGFLSANLQAGGAAGADPGWRRGDHTGSRWAQLGMPQAAGGAAPGALRILPTSGCKELSTQ